MSTRSYISRLNDNGSVTGIYCHFDGYLDGVGMMLKNNYTTPEKLDDLLSLGDISCLGPSPDDRTEAYARDRGDELNPPVTFTTTEGLGKEAYVELGAEFSYVFNGSGWVYYTPDSGPAPL